MPRPSFAQTRQGLLLPGPGRGGHRQPADGRHHPVTARPRAARAVRIPGRGRTMGLTTNTTRVIVFCISAFLAGIGGILYGGAVNFATTSDVHFGSFQSLVLLAVLALAPFAEPWYALFWASRGHPRVLDESNATYWLNVIFGFFADRGLAPGRPAARCRLALARPARALPSPPGTATASPLRIGSVAVIEQAASAAAGARGRQARRPLRRSGRRRRTELLRTARAASPDSSGPTGPVRPPRSTRAAASTAASAARFGCTARRHRLGPAARGRLGLGRTFQRMQLGDSLTVAENVALGREAGLAGGKRLEPAARPPAQRHADRPRHRRGPGTVRDRRPRRRSRPARCPPGSGGWSSWPAAWPARSTS